MTNRWRWAVLPLLIAVIGAGSSGVASAHTETDVVAVPAGSTATVTLRPQHGCAGSPTIDVAVRAPVAGAVAEEVDGWVATSTADGDTFTVLEWSGGVLPADEHGAFPVEFVVPDTVGELLVFPAVQGCEDGSELAWISGDPAAEFPAPRLLILAAGSEPAATIDDVPLDAPGRDQLVAIVDVDNPSGPDAPAASTPDSTPDAAPAVQPPVVSELTPSEPSSNEPPATETVNTDRQSESTIASDIADTATVDSVVGGDESDDGSSSAPWVLAGILLLIAVAIAAVLIAAAVAARSLDAGVSGSSDLVKDGATGQIM